MEAVPVDELAVAEREDLHGGPVALDGDPDHVDRADRAPVGGLALGEVPHREQPVAVARRLLEALAPRAASRIRCSSSRWIGLVSPERNSTTPSMISRYSSCETYPTHGAPAALDVVVEARDPGVPPRLRALARPEPEDAVEDVERLAHLLRVRVRAEVDDAAPVPLAGEHDARVVVLDGDGDVRERLVVAQPDVERRPVALDEVLLEVERLDLVAGDDHLDVVDPRRRAARSVRASSAARWKY